jgi:hypothetical protein
VQPPRLITSPAFAITGLGGNSIYQARGKVKRKTGYSLILVKSKYLAWMPCEWFILRLHMQGAGAYGVRSGQFEKEGIKAMVCSSGRVVNSEDRHMNMSWPWTSFKLIYTDRRSYDS